MDSSFAYDLDVNTIDVKQKPIENWYVCGAFGSTNEVVVAEGKVLLAEGLLRVEVFPLVHRQMHQKPRI